MVERAHKVLREREREHRIAQQPEATGGRRHEAGALACFVDDLARRAHAFGAVVGHQARACQPLQGVGQVPAQRLRVLERGVGPAHAKDGQQVRGVAGEHHTAVHEVR